MLLRLELISIDKNKNEKINALNGQVKWSEAISFNTSLQLTHHPKGTNHSSEYLHGQHSQKNSVNGATAHIVCNNVLRSSFQTY